LVVEEDGSDCLRIRSLLKPEIEPPALSGFSLFRECGIER